jgi:hypothetical protein
MARRIEVELTSSRDDGTWTWRAAGARQPKGVLDGGLLHDGAKVGDVLRADADFDVDGITVVAVLGPRQDRAQPDLLEITGSGGDVEPVTTNLVEKRRGDKRPRDRGERSDRGGRGRGPRRDGKDDRGQRREGRDDRGRGAGGRGRDDQRRDGGDRDQGKGRSRAPRREKPPADKKPKAPRLRPKRVHRDAVLGALPDEQRPVAEQVLRGGVPAVRQALDKQNEEAKAAGQPTVKTDAIVSLAEELLPALREAEWRDRADAAVAGIESVDLRDLRSVVVAADASARTPEAREQAEAIRAGLAGRVDRDQAAWLAELAQTLADGRAVRALRLSSRPPKAGSPLPTDLASRLAEAAGASLTADITADRYATVLDALAYSPVRAQALPQGVPEKPTDELLAVVGKLASRVPQVAERFGVAPTPAPKGRGRKRAIPAPPTLPAPESPTPTDTTEVAAPESAPSPPPTADTTEVAAPEDPSNLS